MSKDQNSMNEKSSPNLLAVYTIIRTIQAYNFKEGNMPCMNYLC